MTKLSGRLASLVVVALALSQEVHAEEAGLLPSAGLTLEAGALSGHNSDTCGSCDFDGGLYLPLQLGYRLSTGTGVYGFMGAGVGGKEVFPLLAYGLGVQQTLKIGKVEPYLQLGVASFVDGAEQSLEPAIGLGTTYRIGARSGLGLAASHIVDDGSLGSLDWTVRAYFQWQLPL